MTRLKSEFNKNGLTYLQLKRESVELLSGEERTVVMYKATHQKKGFVVGYEVFIIPVRKKETKAPNGTIIPPGERVPGNEEFGKGVKGYFCGGSSSKLRGEERYQELIAYLKELTPRKTKNN